jgi:hypothetical protein
MRLEIREVRNAFTTDRMIKKTINADIEERQTQMLKVVYHLVLRKSSASGQRQEQ